MKVMSEDDGTTRKKVLSYLGFSVPTKEKDSVEDLSPELKALELEDRKSTRLNSSHLRRSRMPSSA